MSSSTIYEHNVPVIYLIGRDINRVRHITKVSDFIPYCYIPGNSRPDLFGRLVDRIDFRTTGDVEFERRKHEFVDEADLPFDAYRYMIDKKLFAAWSVEEHKVLPKPSIGVPPKIQYFDIETHNPKELLPRPENPDYPIVAISNSNNYDNDITVFALGVPQVPIEVDGIKPRIEVFDNEIEMLKAWVDYTVNLDPDVPTGWNSNRFDLPYLINRAQKKLHTRVLDDLSPFGKVEVKQFGQRIISIIEGRSPVDMHDAYLKRSIASGQLPSYDFKYVVGLPIKEGGCDYHYEDYGDRIDDLLVTQRYDVFLDYCCRDAIAARLLDKTQGLFQFYWGLKKKIGLPLRDSLENSKCIDMWCLRISDRPLPTNPRTNKKREKLKGAVVLEPRVGIHKNVALFDFSSMYPNLIMAHNLSPEMKNDHGDIFIGPLPDGRTVRFLSKPEGLLPKAVRLLMEEREVLREKRKRLEKEGQADTPEYNLTKSNETIVKFLLCSFYGVMGFPAFRLFDLDVANAITFLGRDAILLCRDIIRKNGYDVIYGDSVTADMAVTIRDLTGKVDILPISELAPNVPGYFQKNIEVLTRDGFKQIKYVKVAQTSKKIMRVDTSDGIVEVTEDHSLFTPEEEEVEPSENPQRIETGKYVYGKDDEEVTFEEARILGIICAEGSLIADNDQPVINCNKEELESIQKDLQVLGFESYLHNYTKSSRCFRLCVSVKAQGLFRECMTKLKGWKGRNKKVPKRILNASDDIILEFLETFWKGDGSLTDNKRYVDEFKRTDVRSHALAAGIEYLLYRIGYMVTWRSAGINKLSFGLRVGKSKRLPEGTVRSIRPYNYNGLVYDICTDNGTFNIGRVVAHNTDSIFVLLNSSNWREGLLLERIINERLAQRAVFRKANYPLEVKYESFFRRLLFKKLSSSKEMKAAKKMYAGHLTLADGIEVNRLHIRGLAPRRSDSAEITRSTMREFLRLTLLKDNPQEAIRYLRDQYNKVDMLDPMKTFIPRGVHILTPKSPWVRGMQYMMKNYKVVFREDKKPLLGWVKTTRGIPSTKVVCIADGINVPEGIIIDWSLMREKLFKKKFEDILKGIGYEWSEISSGQRQQRLF